MRIVSCGKHESGEMSISTGHWPLAADEWIEGATRRAAPPLMRPHQTFTAANHPFVLFASPRNRIAGSVVAFSLERTPMSLRVRVTFLLLLISVCAGSLVVAQELGGAGTIQGTITDPSGGVMQAVEVKLNNPVSGLSRTTTTDAAGKFVFHNLPPNPYHLTVQAQGFKAVERDVDVRSGVPIDVNLKLEVGVTESVSVVGHTEDLVERDPTAHTDIDQAIITKVPIEAASGLNSVIMKASPGVAADANGFFHPLGDHAQTQFSIDNQPIADQQSRIYSNQISPDAVQSMEVMTGVAPAEFGDKTSLVVRIVTKSGLDSKPTGSASFGFGWMAGGSCASAGQTTTNGCPSPSGDVSFGMGSHTIGNFFSATGLSSDRFLDPPEFTAIHGHGTSG